MRRLLIIWLSILPLVVSAANTLSLSVPSGQPGDEITLTASFSNTDAITAVEVVIPLGEYISYVPSSAQLAATRSNGHSLTASQVGTELRVYIYSLSLQPIQGSAGELFTCRLRLGNKPMTQNLQPQVVLSDASGAPVACTTQSASVMILASEMRVETPSIDFGHIPIRSVYKESLVVTNTGNQPLTIFSIAFSDAEFSTMNVPLVIDAGSTQSITINYAPTAHGAVTSKLTIYSNAVNGMYNAVRDVALMADPFSVNELHVGNNSGVVDDTVTIALTMNNMEPITAGEVRFVLPSTLKAIEDSFSLSSSRSVDHQTMLRAIDDTLILYFFSPSNTPLVGEEGEIGSFRLRLDGTSGYYELKPTDVVLSNSSAANMVSASTSGYVTIQSPQISANTSLSFGKISVIESAETILDVSNYGDAPLIIERVTFLAEGYNCLTTFPLVIEPWNSASLRVQYTPFAEGDFGSTMQIYTNDPNNRMFSVTLSGVVYEPNSLTLDGKVSGDTCILSIGMDNYSTITALQFDISGLAENDVELFPSARLSQHAATLVPLSAGAYRVIVYNISNTPISGHDGELLQLRFTIGDVATILCEIDNIVLSNPLGQNKCTIPTTTWSKTRTYIITWKQDDGTLIDQTEVEYGSMPTHAAPSKPATTQYTYTFAGWTPEVVAVTGNATYTATYSSTLRKYTITFLDEDGSVLCEDKLEYGTMPSCEDPTKEEDEQYTYVFAGWTPEVVKVTGSATYTATFTPVQKSTEDILEMYIEPQAIKIFRNGQVLILRGDKTYTITGQEIKQVK